MYIYKENLEELSAFAKVAEKFCNLIESLENNKPSDLFSQLETLLAHLHTTAMDIRMDSPENEHKQFMKLELTHDQWLDIGNTINTATNKEADELAERYMELCDKKTNTMMTV